MEEVDIEIVSDMEIVIIICISVIGIEEGWTHHMIQQFSSVGVEGKRAFSLTLSGHIYPDTKHAILLLLLCTCSNT